MSYIVDQNLPNGADIAAGLVPGWSLVHKFGRHLAVGTSFVPVSVGGIYLTPQPAAATTLRVKAGNANDTAAGSGAREVTVQGLDETGALVSEALATAGASASATTSATFIRLFRVFVSSSGTYAAPAAAPAAGSHAADVVIENGAGGTDWLTIDSTDTPKGQSEVAFYSVPLGFNAYVASLLIAIETAASAKPTEIVLVRREAILDAAAPYAPWRALMSFGGLIGVTTLRPNTPIKLSELTDIGFLAKAASGTPAVAIDFEIYLEATT